MSKIRNLTDLVDVLQEDFAWRKKDLSDIRISVDRADGSHSEGLAVRSAIAILYAHWEGFVRCVASSYVEYVARQRLRYGELVDSFVALSARAALNRAAQESNVSVHCEIVRLLRDRQDERANVPHSGAINTKSNLNSNVFRNILLTLGLDSLPYETKRTLIDEKLLAHRNSIAHGQYVLLRPQDYRVLHSEIFSMMQSFYDDVLNAASSRRFTRQQAHA